MRSSYVLDQQKNVLQISPSREWHRGGGGWATRLYHFHSKEFRDFQQPVGWVALQEHSSVFNVSMDEEEPGEWLADYYDVVLRRLIIIKIVTLIDVDSTSTFSSYLHHVRLENVFLCVVVRWMVPEKGHRLLLLCNPSTSSLPSSSDQHERHPAVGWSSRAWGSVNNMKNGVQFIPIMTGISSFIRRYGRLERSSQHENDEKNSLIHEQRHQPAE